MPVPRRAPRRWPLWPALLALAAAIVAIVAWVIPGTSPDSAARDAAFGATALLLLGSGGIVWWGLRRRDRG